MKNKWSAVALVIVLSLVIAACSPATEAAQIVEELTEATAIDIEPVTDDRLTKPEASDDSKKVAVEPEPAGTEKPAVEMNTESEAESMRDTPDWFKAELVDVTTGTIFRIEDYHGKVVLLETMAMWCSNCFKQQQQVKTLHDLLGEREDFVSIGLDIDINENADTLAKYVERNGFDWIYTVVPAEVGRELGNLYGNQFLNPPSTPMLIIDANGDVHPLPFGIKSAERLLEALEPFLNN
jgi:hypothetical protein